MTLALASSAFGNGGTIPARYTCQGADVSPPLRWSGAPAGTKSFALIIDDPDAPDPAAPKLTWVHWVVYNIPPTAHELPEDCPQQRLPRGSLLGRNDFRRTAYGGPCPPIGRHRYFHKLYALDCELEDLQEPTKARLLKAMAGHVLAEASLVGTFEK